MGESIILTTDTLSRNATSRRSGRASLLYLVYFISFFCGLTQCFEGVFLPEFKELFHLTYQQQMYVVFAKNFPFLLSFAAALLVRRSGYKNTLAIGMLFYAAGTLLLVPGLRSENYAMVLVGFLAIGTGFTIQMVAANPLMGALGPEDKASSRLNFGNALGAVAQIIAPATLTILIPSTVVSVRDKVGFIVILFLSLGVSLVAVAAATFLCSDAGMSRQISTTAGPIGEDRKTLWSNRRVLLGFATLFLVLGVEACLFSFFRNYLESPEIAGLTATASQRLFTIYFALFALGRLLASWIQKHIEPAIHLRIHLLAGLACATVMIFAKGTTAVASFLVLGFTVSIFFPTLYATAMSGAGELAPQASGLLTLGFLGCAVLPVAQGALADSIGLQRSFMIAIGVYIIALAYAFLELSSRRFPEKRSPSSVANENA